MKKYSIKEIFLTLQGEGARAGTKSVFVRFAGCNLWSGDPDNRAGFGPCAEWCDTDFFKGTAKTAQEVVAEANALWPETGDVRWIVITGGEPSLQLDFEFIGAFRDHGWKIAIETNGTLYNSAIECCDWVVCSPKRGCQINVRCANELKVVVSDSDWSDDELVALENARYWDRLLVQPRAPLTGGLIGSSAADSALKRCVDFVMRHPKWRVSVQTHKYMNLP